MIFFEPLKIFWVDFLSGFLYFPFWWYGHGAKRSWLFFWHRIIFLNEKLGVSVWAKNLFVPMYGQKDWWGFFISFFMRLFQIFVRSLFFVFGAIFFFFFFLLWIIWPFFVVYQLIYFFYE